MKHYTFKSQVVKGQQLGSKIGIPTANLDPKLFPKELKRGVYVAKVVVNNEQLSGILFFGRKVTFGEEIDVLEVNIFDFDQDIYGKEVKVTVGEFIRGEVKFSSVEKLVEQINTDIKKVKQLS